MENEKEILNVEENKTPEGTDQPLENSTDTDGNKGEGEEMISISKKEFETLSNKADDFEKSILLKRLVKLERTTKEGEGDGQQKAEELNLLKQEIEDLKAVVNNSQISQKNSELKSAYQEFIAENKWADNDEIFAKISEKFDSTSANTKDEIVKQLRSISAIEFPNEYQSNLEAKATAKALAEANNLKLGGGSGTPANNNFAKGEESEEEKMSKKYMKNFPPGWAINDKLKK